MDEILALQQQLMAVQNTSTLYKLANRNVMEIVDLLIKRYGLELYFTSDGSIAMTRKRVRDARVLGQHDQRSCF